MIHVWTIACGHTLLTTSGSPLSPSQIELPRDRGGTFEPRIVKKRQCRLSGVYEVVLSLYAKGITTDEISVHSAEIYGASVSKETISRITDKVFADPHSPWQRGGNENANGLS